MSSKHLKTGQLAFSKEIALRYLWSKRSEAFVTIITVISILGVAIGVIVLNMVMAIMSGFEYELKEKIAGTNSHILVSAVQGQLSDWEVVAKKIQAVPGVVSVSGFTQHQGLIRLRDRSSGLLIKGLDQNSASAKQLATYMGLDAGAEVFKAPSVFVPTDDGTEQELNLPGIIIGRQLARSMGLFVGTPISVLSPQVSSTPFGLIPRFRRFVISGIYNSGLVEYESGLAYVKLEDAQRFFDYGNTVSGLEIRVNDIDTSPQVTERIMNELGGLASGYYARDWTESNRPLWEAIQLEKRVYFLVLLLIVIMASFSIITTLIMLVLEKRKDIAILRTMGARSGSIWRIFFIQGAVIGGLGTVLGLIGGYIGCVALKKFGFPLNEQIFQMTEVPVRMQLVNFASVGVCAFLICCLATIYPAFRASRLRPSEVLRYE